MTMPDWTRAAAEEIWQRVFEEGDDAESAFPVYDRLPEDEIAAIIARHAEGEKAILQRAAKWAVEDHDGDVCPAYYYGECPNPDDFPFPDSCTKEKKMECMISRWEKEVAPCRE